MTPTPRTDRRRLLQALLVRAALPAWAGIAAVLPGAAGAQENRGNERERRDGTPARSPPTPGRADREGRDDRPAREGRGNPEDRGGRDDRYEREARPPPPVARRPDGRPNPNQWVDTRYGHSHAYPVLGYRVPQPPPRATVVVHSGRRYWFDGGVWYAGYGGGGYFVTRPPRGVYVSVLPAFATVVTIGLLSYYYANGVYYQQRPSGYLVVDPPAEALFAPEIPGSTRAYVYPRLGQSPEQQASDEYECHRWAVGQSGFDPTLQATGQTAAGDPRRNDYDRATGACLEGRGYTVR